MDVKVFPRSDMPPAYNSLEATSLPSYTSLRRESIDWVLADQLDRVGLGDGGEENESATDLQIKSAEPSPRRRRYVFGICRARTQHCIHHSVCSMLPAVCCADQEREDLRIPPPGM